jgi:NAD(P)-dependent dehydrogenase (short-subunit alcohol dehydrogenase family)
LKQNSTKYELLSIKTDNNYLYFLLGELDLDNLHYTNGRKYSAWGAYGQSKLANLLFTKGLHARLVSEPENMISALAVHPGVIRQKF